MRKTVCKGFLLIGSLSTLLVLARPAAAQDLTPTGTRGGRFGNQFPTIQQRATDKITRFQERINERQQQLSRRIKERVLRVVQRLRNVIERLRRHIAKIRELAVRLAAERGISVASVESLLTSAEAEIASAESKLNELEREVNAFDPSTMPPSSVIDAIYEKFRSIHQDLLDARKFLYDAIRTLNELRVSSRPTRAPRATITPTAVPTVSP